ncbi:hypothetical protein cypCar_00003684 [Cyprinus carpio]|nr:hypothetical protein cypCar_00003684 [Cyprinus carpio]
MALKQQGPVGYAGYKDIRERLGKTGEYATDEEEEAGQTGTDRDVAIEVFDLPENEDIISPSELDATKLYQKFRELQIKHTVTEAEIQKLKNKLAAVEKEKARWEREKTQLKQSIEDNKERMLKLESYWIEAQTLCHTVNEHLKEAQSQYQTLEKKYNKAKKLIKDFQQREMEFAQREDAEKKRLEEAEKAHLAEIQSLQVRIATLESELMQLMKQNGIQINNNNNSAESRAQLTERLTALQCPRRSVAGGAEICFCVLRDMDELTGTSESRLREMRGIWLILIQDALCHRGPRLSTPAQDIMKATSFSPISVISWWYDWYQVIVCGQMRKELILLSLMDLSLSSTMPTEISGLPDAMRNVQPGSGPQSSRMAGVTEARLRHPQPQGPDNEGSSASHDDKSGKKLLDLGSTGPSAENSPEICKSKILDDGPPPKPYQWQNRSVTEWTCQQVSCWLMGLNLEQYVSLFTAKNVDGEQLLKLDSASLKALGVESSQDRALIKKKLKDLKVLMEKARRNREKMEKQRNKELEQVQKQVRKNSNSSGPGEGATE